LADGVMKERSGMGLTAKRLTTPITTTMIPAPITRRQAHMPMFFGLVASLFRLARSALPTRTMAVPSMTKPDFGLKSGQQRAKCCLNRGSSVRIRKPAVLVRRASVDGKELPGTHH
jgi:hypothetical protein